MKVLGFDVSSKTLAYALLEYNSCKEIILVDTNYIKPPKEGNIIERLAETRTKVSEIISKYNPDHIAIENIIEFMAGKSSAKTIGTLTSFNRMVGLLAYDHLKRSPELISVMTIRHALKMTKALPKKEDMPMLTANILGITFPFQYKKNGKLKDECGDLADSIAVALYLTLKLTNKLEKMKLDRKFL